MKANEDKNLEKFTDKLMKETSLDSPSPDFTSMLMAQVKATEIERATVYKPLISKRTWFIILGAIIALAGYFIFNPGTQAAGWSPNLDLSSVNEDLKNLSAFKFSTITMYSVLLLAVLLVVQITFLKNHFNKRFKV